MNPWLVPVTGIRRVPGASRREVRSGRVGQLTVAGSVVPAEAEAVARAVLVSVDGGIEVSASVSAPWKAECRRCLAPISGELRIEVREIYRPRSRGGGEDDETYPLDGELLDLKPLVRDALLLELPLAPLCRDTCKGLCGACGADLNSGPCGCETSLEDPRWAALDALRGDCH